MKGAYLAFIGRDAVRKRVVQAAGRAGFSGIADTDALCVHAAADIPVRTMEDGAVLLGDIHSLSGATCHAPSDGWGNHISFAERGDAVHIDRAALTGLPLYWTKFGGGLLCFSHLDLVAGLLPARAFDWDFIAHSLAYSNLRTERTGLVGVEELLPGTRIEIVRGEAATILLWSPWHHVESPSDLAVADLGDQLERRIIACTRAWCSGRESVLLELSGGLDSSIVAAALAACGANASAITFVTPGADGDERHFARAVAEHCGLGLVELAHSDDGVSLTAPPDILHVRPAAYGVLGGIDAAFEQAVPGDDVAVFGGIGGDNVFGFDTSVAPILDAFAHFGFGRQFLRTMRDVARAGDATVWEAARLSLRAARTRPRGWRRDTDFLALANLPERRFEHPWDAGEAEAPRGKRNHVRSLRRILDFVDRPRRWRHRDVVAPLLSQPVVEFCLSVPSWTWVSGGRDRAVARAAFAARLPPEIAWRRGKGRLDSLCTTAYLRQRGDLAELLLDGRLAARGLLDRLAIEAYLARDLVEGDFAYFRLLEIADVERWIASIEASPLLEPSARQR